jgi:serine/threonine protein kinase
MCMRRTVYDEIGRGTLSADRTYLGRLAHSMLHSLQYIHGCGMVHRDVKACDWGLQGTMLASPMLPTCYKSYVYVLLMAGESPSAVPR